MIYLHLLYCMAYKPRRSKKHHWEGEDASAFYREKPQVLKKERGKVEKAMDVAIHDADRGSSVPALWSPRILHRSPKRYIMFLQDAVVCRYLQMMFQLVSTIISRYWLFFLSTVSLHWFRKIQWFPHQIYRGVLPQVPCRKTRQKRS